MEDFEPKQPSQPVSNDLQEQLDSLRHLIVSMLVLAIVVSGTFNLFLLWQLQYARRDPAEVRSQSSQMIAEYNRSTQDFLKKITDYGQTHPDFAPILTKYGVRATPMTGAPPATATSPAAKPPKK